MERVLVVKDEIQTLGELIDALRQIEAAPTDTQNVLDAVYVYGPNGNHLRVKLVETTLTDRSHVYDVTIEEKAY